MWHRCAYELLYLLRCFSLTVYCTMCWCWHPFLNLNCCKPFMYSLGLMVEWSSVTVPQMTEMAQGAKCACVKRVKPQLPRTFSWYCTCVAHPSHFFWLFLWSFKIKEKLQFYLKYVFLKCFRESCYISTDESLLFHHCYRAYRIRHI